MDCRLGVSYPVDQGIIITAAVDEGVPSAGGVAGGLFCLSGCREIVGVGAQAELAGLQRHSVPEKQQIKFVTYHEQWMVKQTVFDKQTRHDCSNPLDLMQPLPGKEETD